MSPTIRIVDLLRGGATTALVAVPFVPYVAVGDQQYAAIGFIERVNALLGMQVIDGSWRVPPMLALITSVSALAVLALPRTQRTRGRVCAMLLSVLSATMAYRFTGQSVILHPLMGPKLLVAGAALSFGAVALDLRATRVGQRRRSRRALLPLP